MHMAGESLMGGDIFDAPSPVIFKPGMALRDIEKAVILETLRQQSFNRTRTAKVLGIGIRTLQRKLKDYRSSEAAQDLAVAAN